MKTNLETRIQSLDMEDYIFQIEVPTEEVTEIKNGQRKQVQRKVYPGYILVRMDLNDDSWSAVRNTPGVTGFVGATAQRPSPLTIDEVVQDPRPAAPTQDRPRRGEPAGADRRCRVTEVDFAVGESVTVMDGPFATPAGHHQRGQRRRAEAEGAGLDLRPRDPGRAAFNQVAKI